MKTRKSIAALALVVLMGGVLPMTVVAQSSGLTDYEKQSRETFKKQQKQAKKSREEAVQGHPEGAKEASQGLQEIFGRTEEARIDALDALGD